MQRHCPTFNLTFGSVIKQRNCNICNTSDGCLWSQCELRSCPLTQLKLAKAAAASLFFNLWANITPQHQSLKACVTLAVCFTTTLHYNLDFCLNCALKTL
ncbi:hypothetical protein INR49_015101 [Caranx melampygus]|nr:hypothetical protein INR49_015101 [Caranx melampygus]